jgi:hypothetical protein
LTTTALTPTECPAVCTTLAQDGFPSQATNRGRSHTSPASDESDGAARP